MWKDGIQDQYVYISVKGQLKCENLFGKITHLKDLIVRNMSVKSMYGNKKSTFHSFLRFPRY